MTSTDSIKIINRQSFNHNELNNINNVDDSDTDQLTPSEDNGVTYFF